MEYIDAKTIISAVKPTDDYIYRDYNMNIYRGCSHGCIYCDSRSLCYEIDRFDTVRAKKNALMMIEQELKRKRKAGIVATGAMSDPYNPHEEELALTRGALVLLERYGYGVSITTKSDLVVRDKDLLEAIAKNAVADVRFTITTLDDTLAAKIEPGAPSSSQRFAALERLSAGGIFTGVFIMPALPFLTDNEENICGLVRRAADCGAKNVVCMPGMTLRAGNREYYYQALHAHFPGMAQQYINTFGNQYVCSSPRAEAIYEAFREECRARNILYSFRRINEALRAQMQKQISLFDI